jgi:anti-sigma regulatory factor (Ser/Thr protein kinase)
LRTEAREAEVGLEHPALLYADLDEFLSALVPFVSEGLDRGDPVFAAIGSEEVAALWHAVGEAPDLTVTDTREWHPRTMPRLSAFHEFVRDSLSRGARRVRLVAEPAWPSGPPEMIREWQRYESALNEALRTFPVTLVCTYPTARIEATIAASALRTHPAVRNGQRRASPDFVEPTEFLRTEAPAALVPPAAAVAMADPANLVRARRFVVERATEAGLPPPRIYDLTVAVSEILTNATRHGSSPTSLRVWTDRDRFLCQVEDHGPGGVHPLAGYLPPRGGPEDGRGLWIARQLSDLVEIATGPGGTTVRIHMGFAPR